MISRSVTHRRPAQAIRERVALWPKTTEGNEPTHLNNHHIDTLSSISRTRRGTTFGWVDVVSLAEAAGTVEEKHDGKFRITIGGEVEVFTRPKHKDIDLEQVLDFRRMFKNAGPSRSNPARRSSDVGTWRDQQSQSRR